MTAHDDFDIQFHRARMQGIVDYVRLLALQEEVGAPIDEKTLGTMISYMAGVADTVDRLLEHLEGES